MSVLEVRFHDKEDDTKRCRHELDKLQQVHQITLQELDDYNVK
jgi:hypothetical protein